MLLYPSNSNNKSKIGIIIGIKNGTNIRTNIGTNMEPTLESKLKSTLESTLKSTSEVNWNFYTIFYNFSAFKFGTNIEINCGIRRELNNNINSFIHIIAFCFTWGSTLYLHPFYFSAEMPGDPFVLIQLLNSNFIVFYWDIIVIYILFLW